MFYQIGNFRSQMLSKIRTIVKCHYSFSTSDDGSEETINSLLRNDSFCLEEDNPMVSIISKFFRFSI